MKKPARYTNFNLLLLFGRGPNGVMERLVLTQMCNRHAIRTKVNKASKQAKRGECLPCERLVQRKRHVGKKAPLAHGTLSYFYDLKS